MSTRTELLEPIPENIAQAASLLREGQVLGMPTETVYGLAASAWDPSALAQVFSAKERPSFDPLILHVPHSWNSLAALGREGVVDIARLSPIAAAKTEALIEKFWPGPLTLVLPKTDRVPDLATSGLPSVGVRMPAHPVAQALLGECCFPLAAPSANRFGRISPTLAAHVLEELGGRIPVVLDGGPCTVGLESTVLLVEPSGELRLLRPGAVTKTQIENATGCGVSEKAAEESGSTPLPSPGLTASHYAPAKPLFLLNEPLQILANADACLPALGEIRGSAALMTLRPAEPSALAWLSARLGVEIQPVVLSERGDLTEAAKNFFAELRRMDVSNSSVLLAEPLENSTGLGYALMDRLRRAARK